MGGYIYINISETRLGSLPEFFVEYVHGRYIKNKIQKVNHKKWL